MTTGTWLWLAALLGCLPPGSAARIRLAGVVGRQAANTAGDASKVSNPWPWFVGPWRGAWRRGVTGGPSAATVSCVLGLGCCLALNALCGVLLGITCAVACWMLRVRLIERSTDASRSDLCDGVAALAAECRSGAPLAVAFATASASAGVHTAAFVAAGSAIAAGEDPGEVCARSITGAEGLALACTMSYSAGSSLAVMLSGIAEDLAAEQATRRSLRTALAGPRSSAVLLATLPAVGLLMGTAMGASPATVLISTPYGAAALAGGVVLELVGLIWTTALAHRGWRSAT